jgi:signal transduction histidine kinase
VVQLVSEYRALRASVLSLWIADIGESDAAHLVDVIRFNEAVDQALAESVARYERMVKQSQNMFLAILGHDLRNPLGTMVTGSSILVQAADMPPRYVQVATRMFNTVRRMSKLIDDLIDFTRTRLGPGIPVKVRQGDFAALCEAVVDELHTSHPQRVIELHTPASLEATFDDSRLAQVLSNLIGNAIQHGRADAPVTVRVACQGDAVVVTVNNRGQTIPPESIPRIFDPMVRATSGAGHGDHAERTSLGLGLYISHEIVHAHGGNIDVASNATDGTTFTVTMPRQPAGHG